MFKLVHIEYPCSNRLLRKLKLIIYSRCMLRKASLKTVGFQCDFIIKLICGIIFLIIETENTNWYLIVIRNSDERCEKLQGCTYKSLFSVRGGWFGRRNRRWGTFRPYDRL